MSTDHDDWTAARAASFDTVVEDYDRYRAPYPASVVEALLTAARIDATASVVEFACGTGQLSTALAATGAMLVCVEPGAQLAARAARNLAAHPNARVEQATFEEWPGRPDGARVDAVVVANAFHWLDPTLRITRPAALLHPGGVLAVVHVQHVGGTPGFAELSQQAYVDAGLAADLDYRPPRPEDLAPFYPELDAAPAYARVERVRIRQVIAHTTTTYVGWLRTDSLVNTLAPPARARVLAQIADLVDTRFGGRIERHHLYEIITATRG